jgi:hypothetical protein
VENLPLKSQNKLRELYRAYLDEGLTPIEARRCIDVTESFMLKYIQECLDDGMTMEEIEERLG